MHHILVQSYTKNLYLLILFLIRPPKRQGTFDCTFAILGVHPEAQTMVCYEAKYHLVIFNELFAACAT